METGTITIEMKRDGLEMVTDREQFAMALKTWRIRQGLTQAQLGKRWGISRYTIMDAERARPLTWRSVYRMFNQLAEELRKEGSV